MCATGSVVASIKYDYLYINCILIECLWVVKELEPLPASPKYYKIQDARHQTQSAVIDFQKQSKSHVCQYE